MSKVILICGMICSGKTTYANKLCGCSKSIILSVDEIMLSLFSEQSEEKHDDCVKMVKEYLLYKTLTLIDTGVDIILDWGFWTKDERARVKAFYHDRGIACELHYIDVDPISWDEMINKRNSDMASCKAKAYFVDYALREKCISIFEVPENMEVDVYVSLGIYNEER